MFKGTKDTVLIAKWTPGQDFSADRPYTVVWGDGRPATYEDYLAHMVGTHSWLEGSNGMELYMFSDIVAEVRYDHHVQRWHVSGIGVTPATLDLTDPNAPDDQIVAELYTHPIVYQ